MANTKVILKQDVKGLGKTGDIVEVSDGYARNFLLPKKVAIEANADSLNAIKIKKNAETAKKERLLAQAKETAQKLGSITVMIKAKAGENGKLFGSITSKDISENLKSQFGIEIDKKKFEMEDALRHIGEATVQIKIQPGVIAKLKVVVGAGA